MTKYSIKEISMAWDKFTGPVYLVDNRKIVQWEVAKTHQILIDDTNPIRILKTDYSRWIPYLISEEWKEPKGKDK